MLLCATRAQGKAPGEGVLGVTKELLQESVGITIVRGGCNADEHFAGRGRDSQHRVGARGALK